MRNHNLEYQDKPDRLYAYDFDYLMHGYMMQSFAPWFVPGKALEMGCYHGEFTKYIAKHFNDITVLEAASDLIHIATENCVNQPAKIKFIQSLFETAELTEQYDAIFLIHTLEHLDDSVAVLNKINQWLSPQGRLFVAVPNAYAASRQIAVKMGLIPSNNAVSSGEWEHGHRRTYSFDTLELEAKQAGLNVLHRGGVFFKAFANFQFDLMIQHKIINSAYLDACYALGMQYPELCASIFLVCGKGNI